MPTTDHDLKDLLTKVLQKYNVQKIEPIVEAQMKAIAHYWEDNTDWDIPLEVQEYLEGARNENHGISKTVGKSVDRET